MSITEVRKEWLGLNWQINPASGWGLIGLNVALHAERSQRWIPVPLYPPSITDWIQPDQKNALQMIFDREQEVIEKLNEHSEDTCHLQFPVLHVLGNGITRPNELERIVGTPNIAMIVIENTFLDSQARASAGKFKRLLAGSNWNTEILRKNGISNVETFLQAIDTSLFHPRPRRADNGGPFMVFSGGKLEYRKGQDITIAAFRRFQNRHPDAVLVTAWHNFWPAAMRDLDRSGHVSGLPDVDADGRLQIVEWLGKNGIPSAGCFDVGLVPNHLLPDVYAQADVAVFPNRCEGGTNLVAMECMACGVPTILSANTGHLDLIDEQHCYALTRQLPVEPSADVQGTDGWGESSVDELVELLERVYIDRSEGFNRGACGARFIRKWSWSDRMERLNHYLVPNS